MPLAVALPVDNVDAHNRFRFSPLVRLLLIVLLVLGASISATAFAPQAHAASARLTDFDNRMLDLVNDARSNAGLPEVQAATGLTNLSLWWSNQLGDGATGYVLQHNPNAFQQTLTYGASNRTTWAENVAKWSPTSVTADAIFNAYWNSPGHKANILGASYRYIGIASVTGSNDVSWNTMTFTDKVDPGQVYVPVTPKGSVDAITVSGGVIRVTGWAYDPNSVPTSIPVHVYVNGSFRTALTANGARPDVNAAFGLTGNHGFDGTTAAVNGNNTVCVFGLSVSGTANTLMLCKDLTWNAVLPPIGSLDSVTLAGSTIKVSGWTYDPANISGSNTVNVTINGTAAATLAANGSRPDVNAALGLTGSHGYIANIAAKTGANQVCVTAVTIGGGNTAALGCSTVNYSAPQPAVGAIDAVTRSGNSVTVSGWAYDPSSKSVSNPVHVYINGVGTALTANKLRADVNAAFGLTGNHGYTDTVSSTGGSLEVCLFSISVSGGDNTLLGCRTLAAPAAAQPTFGSLDSVTRTGTSIRVAGWAIDPSSPGATIPVHIYVNNVGTAVSADNTRTDVNNAYGVTGKHGFDDIVTGPATGAATVCVFAISVSGGDNTLVECRNV